MKIPLRLENEPSDAPASKRSGGCVEVGERNVEAVSKCRSELSKRRFAWGFLRAKDVEAVEARPRKPVSKPCRRAPTSTTSTTDHEPTGKRSSRYRMGADE